MPHRRAEQAAVALQRSLQRRSSRKAATPRTRQRRRIDSWAARAQPLACCRSTHGLAETSGCRGSAEPRRVPRAGRELLPPALRSGDRGQDSAGAARRLKCQRATRQLVGDVPAASGPRLAKALAPPEPVAVQPVGHDAATAPCVRVTRVLECGVRLERDPRPRRLAATRAWASSAAAELHRPAANALDEEIIRVPLGTRLAPRPPCPLSRGTGVRNGRASE